MIYLTEVDGCKYLEEHTIPVPMYDVGDTVEYAETTGGAIVTSVIEGYEVAVFSFTDKQGTLDTDCNIIYTLEDGSSIPEDFIIGQKV
jgi:hypothetical protein